MQENSLQNYKVCHGEKSISQVHDEQAYITEKRIPVGQLETLSNDKKSKALEQADHGIINIGGFSTQVKQTPSENDIGTADPPKGEEMDSMIL